MPFPFHEYRNAGLSVIPVQLPRKTPVIPWLEYQREIVNQDIAKQWRYDAGAIIAGAVSGNTLCIDIDTKNDPSGTIYHRFTETIIGTDPTLLQKAVIQSTYNGGMHLIYKVPHMVGNTKLASTREKLVIIETRGEGGYFVAYPSKGYELIQGKFTEIQMLTDYEQKLLFDIATTFDENTPLHTKQQSAEIQQTYYSVTENNLRIGDEYDAKTTAADIARLLECYGWSVGKQRADGTIEVTRPGKSIQDGISGTIGYNNSGNKLYVFTSSSVFEPNRMYKPHQVLCFLQFGGDFKAMAKYLAQQYYSPKKEKRKISAQTDEADFRMNMPEHESEEHDSQKRKKNTTKYITIIKQWINERYTLRYNTLRERTEILRNEEYWQGLEDRDIDTMLVSLSEQGLYYPKEKILQLLNSEWVENYDPVAEWIAILPAWNKEEYPDYIEQLADTIEISEKQRAFFIRWLTNWLVGALATWMGKGINHTCLVLQGEQGIGKTQWLNKLCPEQLKPYLFVGALEAENKDATIAICENLLINLDELESTTRKDISHLKSLITREKVKVRRTYARFAKEYRRKAVFTASVNIDQILNDPTGNRRFIIVTAQSIHYAHTIPMEHVYAQALTLLEQGHKYWGDYAGNAELTANAAFYSMADMVEELLHECCTRPNPDDIFSKAAGTWLSSTQIAHKISEKYSLGRTLLERDIRRMGMILSKHGYQKRIQRGINQFFVIIGKEHEHVPPF